MVKFVSKSGGFVTGVGSTLVGMALPAMLVGSGVGFFSKKKPQKDFGYGMVFGTVATIGVTLLAAIYLVNR